MADKAIGELLEATTITQSDLFVLEQNNTAKKLSGQTLINDLLKELHGHGGIQSITMIGTSGLRDTYRITFADLSTYDFVVTNGAKGDKGDNSYVWIKYSSNNPTQDSDMYDTPDDWMGVYSGNSASPPTSYTAYKWFDTKGDKGDTGNPATLVTQSVAYQSSESGTVIPSGNWYTEVPAISPGNFLWTRTTISFNSGSPIVSYSVSRYGIDGSGSVASVNNVSPDSNGNVQLTADDVGALPNTYVPPDVPVQSVNGQTGEVKLSAENVGAIPNEDFSVSPRNIEDGAITWEKIQDGTITSEKLAADAVRLLFRDTEVAVSAFVADATYADYPYRAEVTLEGSLASMVPEVILDVADALGGNYSPVATSYDGGIYLYAAEIPATALTIPTIYLMR